jgi:hypothetical protein
LGLWFGERNCIKVGKIESGGILAANRVANPKKSCPSSQFIVLADRSGAELLKKITTTLPSWKVLRSIEAVAMAKTLSGRAAGCQYRHTDDQPTASYSTAQRGFLSTRPGFGAVRSAGILLQTDCGS